ncbi:glycosyltransferase [Hyalangium rubrum]|uniref:Glycosyltransferase n=1 Tax=Hyalangium rubrum TaxID=3103134 RepID=A0ABU5HCB4_9BACT|nr:glycosyltransferase [Hyalangium sp. s54d21]MDY7231094.1 glycosyltransferase [Hyalangium sp. s54d21]
MRICVTTFGSEGDIQPYLALAGGLREAGHEVVFASIDRYAERARALGLTYVTVGRPWVDRPAAEATAAFRERNPAKQAGMFTRLLEEDLAATVPGLLEVTRDVDLVVSHAFNVAGTAAARAHRKPVVVGHLFHNTLRQRRSSPFGIHLGSLGNALMWRMAEAMTRQHTDPPLNRAVVAAGLAPWRDILFRSGHSELLNLVAISPSIVPPDPLWEGRYLVSGYWFTPPSQFTPDARLASFVEGERPVVVTFGSMGGEDPREKTATLVEALRRSGRKAILQAGWGNLGEGELPPNVLRVGFVSHDWLFSHAACVVHHGGAGTTAATLRAGVPSVVVWHLGDQPVWGRILERHGVAPRAIAHTRLTAERLSEALGHVLDEKGFGERARKLAERIHQEDGVTTAVRAIEGALKARAP